MAIDLFAWVLGVFLLLAGFAGLWVSRVVSDISPLTVWSQGAVLAGIASLGTVLRAADAGPWADAVLMVPAMLAVAALTIGLSLLQYEGRRAASWSASGLPALAALLAILTNFLLVMLAPQSHQAGACGLLAVMTAAAGKVAWRQSWRHGNHSRLPLMLLTPACLVLSISLLTTSGIQLMLGYSAGLFASVLVSWLVVERLVWRSRFSGQREPLTGLTRLNGIEEFLTRHFSFPGAEPAVLLKFDVDHLNAVNERYGFETGDEVLRKVAQELVLNFRAGDCVARVSGQQFLVACIGLPADVAQVMAERARQAVSRMSIDLQDGTRLAITVSVGVSRVCETLPACAPACQQADSALRRAKSLGRNLSIAD
ncbi:MAG: diguanylate cyclase [Burkholderiaceae bacterium]